MPKCKLAGCREEAVPGGKRYCPRHLAEYKAKQRAYNLRPDCTSKVSPHCAGKAGQDQLARGWQVCRACEEFPLQQRYEQQMAVRAREIELDSIMDNLDPADFNERQLEQLRAAFNAVLELRHEQSRVAS